VLPVGAPPGNDAGNAFVAEAGDAGQRAPWGGPEVEVEWNADGRLAIRYDAKAEVFFTAAEVGSVPIAVIPAP
ncbi:MAG: hypothetical protein M3Z20_02570, partial [Chloroflexota bacterium]|nr:hypothetical protein [Chloroflexota bacterium]